MAVNIDFSCTSDEVDYKGTGEMLTTKLDSMDETISNKADKSELHEHSNKTVLDGITAEKVSLWDNGTAGADGEDGATFTPSVSSDGVLSWSNNKGLANPAPVNIKGADGANGTNGVDGAKGDKGDKGDPFTYDDFTAAQLASLKGAKGDKGDTGERGIQGIQGEQGEQGIQGVKGDKGDKGDKGEQGEQGIQGIQGVKGDTGATGADGQDGKSAYQIALDNGYVGTQAEWIASLKGAKGDKGDKGDKGESGAVITASEILTKLKTVDGQNSGLDADMLDGHDTTYFATATQVAGKADASHTHSQYATNDDVEALETEIEGKADSTHTHAQGDITGLSTALSGKANATHSHAQSDITGLSTALGNKANASHTHATSDITGLDTALSGKASASHTHSLDDVSETTAKKIMTAAERTKLSGIAAGANKTVVDTAMSSTSTNPVQNKTVNSALSNKVDKVTGKGLSTNDYTTDEKTKLAGIATGANKYTHPTSHPATMITGLADVATTGSYTDLTDKPTSVTPTAHTHAQSDVTGLATALSGKADTGHTHSAASTTANGFMSKEDKTKLNGIATGANKTTVDTALSASSTNPVQNKVINTALAGKSNTNHNHNSAYIAKSLQMTADDGDVAVSWTNQDVVAKIKALGTGMYTAYAKAGTTNNPKTTESWRFLVHKTGATFGWVQAFGSLGSMYIGYVDSGIWKGWKCIFDADPAPLWKGAMYMSSPDSIPQTVTPSKKLSECRNGWLLLWSDYDKDTKKANDSDFVTTMIPKSNPTGGNWGGKAFYCDIPRYMGSNVNDVDTERRIIKSIYIHDNCIKGSFNNDKDERNDVVLRAVFEW